MCLVGQCLTQHTGLGNFTAIITVLYYGTPGNGTNVGKMGPKKDLIRFPTHHQAPFFTLKVLAMLFESRVASYFLREEILFLLFFTIFIILCLLFFFCTSEKSFCPTTHPKMRQQQQQQYRTKKTTGTKISHSYQ